MYMIPLCKTLIEFVAVFISSAENISCDSYVEDSLWLTCEYIDTRIFDHVESIRFHLALASSLGWNDGKLNLEWHDNVSEVFLRRIEICSLDEYR